MDRTESHARKTDRRASYTQKVIKDALLELLGQTPYEKITVAALCRQAEITRATFYLHYLSLDAVLNELLDEAVAVADKVCADMSYEERMGRLAYIAAHGSVRDLKERECLLSPCQRIADDPRYRVLFLDPTISHYAIARLYLAEKENTTRYIMSHCGIPRDQAENLFLFMVSTACSTATAQCAGKKMTSGTICSMSSTSSLPAVWMRYKTERTPEYN